MQTITYDRLQENMITETLDNGLKVFILPKEGFQKTYATFSTKYGSIDNHFQVEGEAAHKVPDGIAHFLEHKMFEEPEGDVFSTFASKGASANAFTSFDRTSYLFSATEHLEENLLTLINFVQRPYFTDENVEKEKGIIGQEITMYQDNPDWRSYFGLIEALYQVHPVHIDIAGTIDSIAKIDKETLYTCYHTFYHPSNMALFVVGGVDAQKLLDLIKDNQQQKSFEPAKPITRFFETEPAQVKQSAMQITLPVSLPKCLMGLKEADVRETGPALLKKECTTKLLLDLIFGPSSKLYQSLYDEGLITDNFGSEYNAYPGFQFSMVGGDTKDPARMQDLIKAYVEELKAKGIDADDFERSRKKKIGLFLRMMNSPEAIANEFTKYLFRDMDLFEVLTIYEQLTLEDVNSRLKEHFDWQQLAVSIVQSEA